MTTNKIKNTLEKVLNFDKFKNKFPQVNKVEVDKIHGFQYKGVENYNIDIILHLKAEYKWSISDRVKFENILENVLDTMGLNKDIVDVHINTQRW